MWLLPSFSRASLAFLGLNPQHGRERGAVTHWLHREDGQLFYPQGGKDWYACREGCQRPPPYTREAAVEPWSRWTWHSVSVGGGKSPSGGQHVQKEGMTLCAEEVATSEHTFPPPQVIKKEKNPLPTKHPDG